uniref:Uncharacterized protein n=1 Tax=Vitis vinifera TaxID=29760 RepID=A5B711_VITVI|nr:hypothetical protein VITISV_039615 [Vitis vinifera]
MWRLASEQPDLQTVVGQQPDPWLVVRHSALSLMGPYAFNGKFAKNPETFFSDNISADAEEECDTLPAITALMHLTKQWILLLKPPVSTLEAIELHILDVMKAANKYGISSGKCLTIPADNEYIRGTPSSRAAPAASTTTASSTSRFDLNDVSMQFKSAAYVVKGEKDGYNGELIGSNQVGMVMRVLEQYFYWHMKTLRVASGVLLDSHQGDGIDCILNSNVDPENPTSCESDSKSICFNLRLEPDTFSSSSILLAHKHGSTQFHQASDQANHQPQQEYRDESKSRNYSEHREYNQ